MSSLFKKEAYALRHGRRVLNTVELEIGQLYHDAVNLLRNGMDDPSRIELLDPVLRRLAELGKAIRECKIKLSLDQLDQAHERLEIWYREIIQDVQSQSKVDTQQRRLLTQTMQSLIWAEGEFNSLQKTYAKKGSELLPKEIQIPSDLVHQCYHSLFPAERMLAVSGRTKGGQIELGAVFEVTGAASAGHVRADPKKLGQALIAMSSTDTHLAAWFHSHPGTGIQSTCPSGIDLKQHRDWLQDYSAGLLSGIFVHDCYLRLWGSGLVEGQIRVTMKGTGVMPVKGEKYVYQIVSG